MNANVTLTAAERDALNEVRKLLGDNLSNFVLSGLGETNVTNRRIFTAQCVPSHGDEVTYQLEIINDSEQGLHIGRDSLVLAALLDLLWAHQPLDSIILFRESDILEKLEWPHGAESQSLIKRALERYLLTAYCLIDHTLAEDELICGRNANIKRLLIGYEMTSVLRPVKRTGQARFARAQFLPALIHDVISERKYFLGIEFQKLKKIDHSVLP
jgi:hypothetical protein